MTPRQREMLYAIEHKKQIAVGLCDLIDPDFRALADGKLIVSWEGKEGSVLVCLSVAGRKTLEAIDN